MYELRKPPEQKMVGSWGEASHVPAHSSLHVPLGSLAETGGSAGWTLVLNQRGESHILW